MEKVNKLVICQSEYETKEAFENAIKTAVMLLLENDYAMMIRYDDKGLGIVVIEYDYSDMELCEYIPRWLKPEEYEEYMDSID